jgi:hypothetical protein
VSKAGEKSEGGALMEEEEEEGAEGGQTHLHERLCMDGVGGDCLRTAATDLEEELHTGEEDAMVAV